MTGHDASRLTPLPIRPRPAAGEPVSSYVRRLARANHLRPSYLHGCLANPPDHLHAISPERLAILSGRTVAVLERTLAGLARPGRDALVQPSRRVTRAADKPGLFAAIRRDAQDGHSIRALAARHQVHRRTIRQALADPVPPPRKTPQRTSALDRLRDPIIAMLAAEPGLPVRQVWEQLLDQHDADVSYATVRDYAMRLRAAGTPDQET
jgi:TniQ